MLEDLIIDKIQQYILQPKYIMTVAADMSGNFNASIKSDKELDLLKKAQAKNEKEIQNTLAAIRMGIVTESTKDMLLELEEKRDKYATEIARISNRKRKTIDKNECADFLFSLTALDFSVPENRKLLFDRFIRRVELGNRKIRIFFNPVDKPYLYAHKEEDLSPPGGFGENEGTEEQNTSPPPQSCSSVDALCPPRRTAFELSGQSSNAITTAPPASEVLELASNASDFCILANMPETEKVLAIYSDGRAFLCLMKLVSTPKSIAKNGIQTEN